MTDQSRSKVMSTTPIPGNPMFAPAAQSTSETRHRCRPSRRLLLGVFGCMFLALAGANEFRKARSERIAYQELCRLGATGDDWIGVRELFLGRGYAPIEQLNVPSSIPLDTAIPLASRLDNLQDLSLSSDTITDSQIAAIHRMWSLNSLRVQSKQISDSTVPQLAQLVRLRFLTLFDTHITDGGLLELQRRLPHCQIKCQISLSKPP